MTLAPVLVLASSSPRRHDFLRQMGVTFEVQPADIDETPHEHENAVAYVRRVSAQKAATIRSQRWPADVAVLAADTTVALDGEILGKPADTHEAVHMLTRLSGREHDVHTAVTVLRDVHGDTCRDNGPGGLSFVLHNIVVTTRVRFDTLSAARIAWYVNTGEPLDKAGAYGLQGVGAVLVREVTGSVSNVVGLPLVETAELLRTVGVHVCE